MKTLKLSLSIVVMLLFMSSSWLNAQTYQVEWVCPFSGYAWCTSRPVTGQAVYHVIYHIDKKTGYISNIHCNIQQCELWDAETGEKYRAIDTGNENIGWSWADWNWILSWAGVIDEPLPLPPAIPGEGHYIAAMFKFISPGGYKVSMTTKAHLQFNANGELTAEHWEQFLDCD